MAIIEQEAPSAIQVEQFDPYFMDANGPEARFLIDRMTSEVLPYVDATTNPDMGNRAIYLLDGSDKFADLARALEAGVYEKDWKQDRSTTSVDSADFEDNSTFFLLTEKTDDGVVLVGTMRIADCAKGKSETREYYKRKKGTDVLPPELSLAEGSDKVWDIVGVALTPDPEKRTGLESIWLNYAMNKRSTELGIKKWISNITKDEIRNLHMIGIPFVEIEEKFEAVEYDEEGNVKEAFRFFTADAKAVPEKVEKNIDRLLKIPGMAQKVALIAIIGRWGSFTRPVVAQTGHTALLAS